MIAKPCFIVTNIGEYYINKYLYYVYYAYCLFGNEL